MELRLDRLLADLRDRQEEILAAIDRDPLLVRRTCDDLILANAGKALYTPVETHQLYAKGIVYQREPYRLVSLPLIKIYNMGERAVTLVDLAQLLDEPGIQMRFLRKMDGSLIQVFRHQGKVWFTTRGMLEGARWRWDEDGADRTPEFDYVGTARQLMQGLYPRLFEDSTLLEGRTLLFEFIHPAARVVTNYGDLADLVLLACFDHQKYRYVPQQELAEIADRSNLRLVETLLPPGENLAEQIDSLLASLAGTDQEGSVLTFENQAEVIYRVKVKSPEYLQLMRLMAFCSYDNTVALIDSRPGIETWPDLEAVLREQGRERVPEEVLGFYREHWDRYQAYVGDLDRLRIWAENERLRIVAEIDAQGLTGGPYRKAYAERAVKGIHPGLLFAALDGRLDRLRLRKMFPSDSETHEVLQKLPGEQQVLN